MSTDPFGLNLPLIGSYEIGRSVECDGCGADLTDDTRSGGFMFDSAVYGPCCAARQMESVRGYGEESHIRGRCTPGMAFADWVREYREATSSTQVRVYLQSRERGQAMRPPGEVVAAAEIEHGQWIEHPEHGRVRVEGLVPWTGDDGVRMRSFSVCLPDGSLLEKTYDAHAGEAVMRVPAPVRPEPEPVLTETEARADAYVTLAGVARQFGLPLPSRVDWWITGTEEQARAEIAAAGTRLAAAGITDAVELIADEYRLGLVLRFDGILAYHMTLLRLANSPAAVQANGAVA